MQLLITEQRMRAHSATPPHYLLELPRNNNFIAMAETLVSKYNLNKVLRDEPLFSAHHPLLPRRYVPAWQLDMKNRKLLSQVCMTHAGYQNSYEVVHFSPCRTVLWLMGKTW